MTPFHLTASQASTLADEFGTPLYVLSEAHFLHQITQLKEALAALPKTRISFATKSNSTLALIQLAHRAGCHIDVASEGELRAAMRAGVHPKDCTLHGNNKSRREIEFALEHGIGEIVVDCLEEIEILSQLGPKCDLAIRINPGLDADLNPKVNTSARFSKFGFPLWTGEADEAIGRLDFVGVHCHLGSQIMDPAVHAGAAKALSALIQRHPEKNWKRLNLGGGFGISYTDEEPAHFNDFIGAIAPHVDPSLEIAFEPGRSLSGPAGLTLYRVGPIKTIGGQRLIAVDGGLADNPRPALYGSRYTVRAFDEGPAASATIVGRHCENDVLFSDIELPVELKTGDLVQVLSTGAYSSSMASNYNRYPRPASVLIRSNGEAQLVQRREGFEEMLAREILIDG